MTTILRDVIRYRYGNTWYSPSTLIPWTRLSWGSSFASKTEVVYCSSFSYGQMSTLFRSATQEQGRRLTTSRVCSQFFSFTSFSFTGIAEPAWGPFIGQQLLLLHPRLPQSLLQQQRVRRSHPLERFAAVLKRWTALLD